MENDNLQKKIHFQSPCPTCAECQPNKYVCKYNRFSDANYGIAYANASGHKKRKGKNKKVTCNKCKKKMLYWSECDEEDTFKTSNKKGQSFLVLKKYQGQCSDIVEEDKEESSDDDDNSEGSYDNYSEFAFLHHDVICSIQDNVPRIIQQPYGH